MDEADPNEVGPDWPWAYRGLTFWLDEFYIWLTPRLPKMLVSRVFMRVITELGENIDSHEAYVALEIINAWEDGYRTD